MLYVGDDSRDFVHGTGEDDTIRGLGGDDILWGEGGDDLLEGGLGKDDLEGGEGNDLLIGGDGRDRIYGSEGHDTLYGDAHNDSLNAYGGGDWLDGGDGDDLLEADARDASDDTWIYGGAGNDSAYCSFRGKHGLLIDLGDGHDGAGVDRTTRATVAGGAGNDSIICQTYAHPTRRLVALGGDGDDFIFVPVQSHTDGVRIVRGGRGDDTIVVSNGGTHELSLGKGADLIEYRRGVLEAALPDRAVWVSDFAAGAGGDDLDLHGILEDFGGAGWWDGVGDPFAQGRLRLVQDGGDTLVEADFDAGGAGYGWTALLRLAGVDAGDLTAANLHGYDPDQQP